MQILKPSKNLEGLAEILKDIILGGKVIVLPTDTVYGLICDVRNPKAVERIFKIKKRPKSKPIGVFVRDLKMAKRFSKINKATEKFLEKSWPGKLTVILKRKGNLPKILFANEKTIGLRIPDCELIKLLFQKIDFPLAQTSANISEVPATTKAKEVLRQFKNQKLQPDLMVDFGNLKKSKPSTVLDLSSNTQKILRKGDLTIKK